MVTQAEIIVERADETMELDIKDKTFLQDGHDNCQKVTQGLQLLDYVLMVEQTKNIKLLVRNHQGWSDLYDRLKELANDELPTLELDLQRANKDT